MEEIELLSSWSRNGYYMYSSVFFLLKFFFKIHSCIKNFSHCQSLREDGKCLTFFTEDGLTNGFFKYFPVLQDTPCILLFSGWRTRRIKSFFPCLRPRCPKAMFWNIRGGFVDCHSLSYIELGAPGFPNS